MNGEPRLLPLVGSLGCRTVSDSSLFVCRTRAVVPEGSGLTSVSPAVVPHSSVYEVVSRFLACHSSRFVPDRSTFDSHIIPMRRDITEPMPLVSERMSVITGLSFHTIAVITHTTAGVSVITALMPRITHKMSVMTALTTEITGVVFVITASCGTSSATRGSSAAGCGRRKTSCGMSSGN